MKVRILHGDMRERLAELADESVDAIVTDPPYGLGFMGKRWDASAVELDPATWAALLRVAKPGAHLVAFGGTRTFHRIWCAIEDTGWEVRDTLMWLYGQGFPKSSNQDGAWQGWGTALKPSYEPVVLARKPPRSPDVAIACACGSDPHPLAHLNLLPPDQPIPAAELRRLRALLQGGMP